jgi:uncharacterized protein YdiU (UPF0061 family)
LIDKNEDTAIKIATEIIDNFEKIYEVKWLNMMRDKLGLFGEDKNDKKLINNLLSWMENNKADYTNTFCYLMNIKIDNNKIYKDENFISWSNKWQNRLTINNNSKEKSIDLMRISNPIVIPRNHKVEEALIRANKNNLETLNKLLSVLKKPYEIQENIKDYQLPLIDKDYQTFCGT